MELQKFPPDIYKGFEPKEKKPLRKQVKKIVVKPVLTAEDSPGVHLNKELMDQMRPKMQKFYYDPKKYNSYLEQLGIPYPGVPAAK
jgi:aminobenzoyl-glutamate utilization protein B